VVSANGNEAVVQIEYGTNGRPDLYIRPWPRGDNWQSPDIEIRNARSLADHRAVVQTWVRMSSSSPGGISIPMVPKATRTRPSSSRVLCRCAPRRWFRGVGLTGV